MRQLFLYLLLMSPIMAINLCAQQEAPELLSKNFAFADGIYLSFADFQRNTPNLTWEEVRAEVFSNPQNFMAQVQYIKKGKEENDTTLDLKKIWGICLGGIPYIRLESGEVEKPLTVFAGLRLRGKICYYNYENEVTKALDMPVYNPVSKRVFRRATIQRRQTILHEKILNFQTGETATFNPKTFRQWIADDKRLIKTLDKMSPDEVHKKLFKCLLIYVDRNEVEIERPPKL